ncbi:hypothetical protein H4R19_007208, partial [Coemansia spiralis]
SNDDDDDDAHAQAPRSMAGEKRQSPDGDDYDNDDDDNGDDDEDDDGSSGAVQARHAPKRASVGAQSTGDDTIGYMSSVQSNSGDSRAGSLQDSPKDRATPRSSDEDRGEGHPEPEPPAAGTRSKTGSVRQGPGAYATPASVVLPSSSRPSQPRPQRSVAR